MSQRLIEQSFFDVEGMEAEIAGGDTYGPFDPKEAIDFLNDNSPSSLGFDSDDR